MGRARAQLMQPISEYESRRGVGLQLRREETPV
jgi:hypothetical protein